MLTRATSSSILNVGSDNMISYKQTGLEDNWDAVVIGSGMGGLATAALLARHAGKRVLVLERHYTAGGFTHAFHRPGYEWDVGVHYVGEVGDARQPLRAAFDHLTEGRLQWNPMPDVYDRIVIAGRAYDFPSGAERFRARMKEYFPRDGAAIDAYLEKVFAAATASSAYFAEKAVPEPVSWVAGSLMRRRFLQYAGVTTASVLQALTRNRELIGVLTGQWGDYGLPPAQSSFGIHAIVAKHYLSGAWYPVGGASQIAKSIAPVIERAGGKIVVSADVEKILTGRAGAIGVRMSDGREFRAKTIVSDAGAFNTFRLLDRPLPPIQPSMSHLSLYVGLKEVVDTGATNLWIYRGPDHDKNAAQFVAHPEAPFPAVFISFPSAKDPDFCQRHPGRSTMEVIAPAPFAWFEKWDQTRWKKRGAEYDEFKQQLAARLIDELETNVPVVKGKVDVAELSTPLTTKHFANYQHGEIYGLSATPERFKMSVGARTEVKNLYLTGADVTCPGVAGALFGGVVAASAILKRNLAARATAA